eukprot:CAMPEP_0170267550 /NCGR_PEP_ID=MMETSP0116_2-20130129/33701_1 /TAXON_ID=400756 /ORGANISM="Durinskia baltica, Strain CSIRO CS-38" /LENGTH=435 /DNA_ID=CAMNT_0010518705 /DNA_START=93 /DNA_END=1400 /DNA_ORIENTATION=+
MAKTGSAVSKLSSLVTGVMSRRRSSVLDAAWEVGSTYPVQGEKALVWSTIEITGQPLVSLNKFDEVTLLEVFAGPQVSIARVFPRSPGRPEVSVPGYVMVENRASDAPSAVLKRKMVHKSWAIGGRYEIVFEATIREGIELDSPEIQDVFCREEVLLLDIGVSQGTSERKPRLRFKVASDTGFVGWMSGITAKDDVMLTTLNLLGPQMVEVRRSYREQESRVFAMSSRTSKVRNYESRLGTNECVALRNWIPRGVYRVLQATDLLEEPRIDAPVIAKLMPGMSVVVERLATKGEFGRPMARVKIVGDDGVQGWAFLICPSGFDNIDTRDLSEFEKVQAWLQSGGGTRADGVGDHGRGADAGNPKGAHSASSHVDQVADVGNIQVILDADGKFDNFQEAPPIPRKRHRDVRDGMLASLAGKPCILECLPAKAIRAP